ncbi:FG-GAP repeat protein [Streptomyces sp. DSM 40484]|uniref:FG-GAP repeat protein n=1 Tax=Streptomyces kroppenstedtii TaxID=3051181 RepID=UPI0028D38518|nr:FG-GAP repeat protein [Streptomyces sp. DSM 40484]
MTGDGKADLIAGAPGEDLGTIRNGGAVCLRRDGRPDGVEVGRAQPRGRMRRRRKPCSPAMARSTTYRKIPRRHEDRRM